MFVEHAIKQLNKHGEELCGDNIEIVKNSDNTVIVLSDGLGSGVKANILSTLTKKIVSTMLSNGLEVEEVVETLINTLPICQSRKIAYSTFTIVQIFDNDEVKLVEFDNPDTFFIHEDCLTPYQSTNSVIAGKNIKISRFKVSKGDFLIMVSDGLIHAGLGGLMKLGWSWDKIGNYIQRNIHTEIDASMLADKLIFIANELYQGKIGDDTSVVVVKIREKRSVCLAFGPPVDKEMDHQMVEMFLNSPGKKIICGGTTANIVARSLNKDIKVICDHDDYSIPPKAKIDGIDLVTEGIITLSKTVEIVDKVKPYNIKKENNSMQNLYQIYEQKGTAQQVLESVHEKSEFIPQNPSEEIAIELQKADKIKFIVGRAINPAHQNPKFPVQSGLKFKLINELKEKLEHFGKEIEIVYF